MYLPNHECVYHSREVSLSFVFFGHGYEEFIGYLQKIGFGGDFEYNCKEVKSWFKQPQSYSVWMLHHKDSYDDRKHHVYILEVSR